MCGRRFFSIYLYVPLGILFLLYEIESKIYSSRPLVEGDTFTIDELLPVTTRLLKKVENPGNGKGIVSSQSGPRHLADKLFEILFRTANRIVTLERADIAALDALQALALSGEVITNCEELVTESAARAKIFRGQQVKRSHYKLVTKKVELDGHEKRRVLDIAKKLKEKRRLVVIMKSGGDEVDSRGSRNESEGRRPTGPASARRDMPGQKRHEYQETRNEIRKMMGISVIDEEVEKIIQKKYMPERQQDNKSEAMEKMMKRFIISSIASNSIMGLYSDQYIHMTKNRKQEHTILSKQ